MNIRYYYRHRWVNLLLLLSFSLSMGTAEAQEQTNIADLRGALQARSYAEAISLGDALIKKKDKDAAEAAYLKAVAHYHARQYAETISAADVVTKSFAESKWIYKAEFLKARAHTELKQFKEAEAIYARQTQRLLSSERKRELAGILVKFAESLSKKPDPNDVGALPPDYGRAYKLYTQALELEIDREMRDKIMYEKAFAIYMAKNYGQAQNDFRAYLEMFDPTWTGPVGSITRLSDQKKLQQVKPGKYVYEARYRLGKSQLNMNQFVTARQNFEDLHQMMVEANKAKPDKDVAIFIGNVNWQIVRSYNLPTSNGGLLDHALKATHDFLQAHPQHPYAVEAAWLIATTNHRHGRMDEAVEAYKAFVDQKEFKLPAGELATTPLKRSNKSPQALYAEWKQQAVYAVGEIRLAQKLYDEARNQYERYTKLFPDGPQWSAAQSRMIDVDYLKIISAVEDDKIEEASKLIQSFIQQHPLDNRARQLVFMLGQMQYVKATELEASKADEKNVNAAYQKAIAEWERMISKYPNTNESSLALFRIGDIYENKLGELEKAIESYRRLTWGSWAGQARQRIAQMTSKQLKVVTPKKFRTNEQPNIELSVRNVEKVTIRQYQLDLESYFRKMHHIKNVHELDISLIEPDSTTEVSIDAYKKYKPFSQTVKIPFENDKPGVSIINVSSDTLEATTLIIRSDIDVVVKTSREETLVFAQNMRTGKVAEGVKLLVSDGGKIIQTGETGKDGVWRASYSELKHINNIGLFAMLGAHTASHNLDMRGMQTPLSLAPKGYIYTDRPAYQPSHTVKLRGIIRDVKDGAYVVPANRDYKLSVIDPAGRLLVEKKVSLNDFGTFHDEAQLDEQATLGQYRITVQPYEGRGVTSSGQFQVDKFQVEKIKLTMDFPKTVYFRGEKVTGTITAMYTWGQPVQNKPLRYYLPDGRSFVTQTDDAGQVKVEFNTVGIRAPRGLPIVASLEGESVGARTVLQLARDGYSISLKPAQDLVLSGEPVDVEIQTNAPDGKTVGQELTIKVLHEKQAESNPVLRGVPWLNYQPRPAAAVTVKEEKVKTDPKTGKTVIRLTLEDGGKYIIRAQGSDRDENVITSQSSLRVSDDEDKTKLRLFADSDTLKVGAGTEIKLHSRIDNGLSLITFEGDGVISYKIINLKKGYNPIKVDVDHVHFPNFTLSAAVMDDQKLHQTAKGFKVERELKLTIKPAKDVYLPGEKGKVQLIVTDQLGNPVKAELSLSLVEEALYQLYADPNPNILNFFQQDALRRASFRAVSSNDFQYHAQTEQIAEAILAEQERLLEELRDEKSLDKAKSEVELKQLARRSRSTTRGLGIASMDDAAKPQAPATASGGALFANESSNGVVDNASFGLQKKGNADRFAGQLGKLAAKRPGQMAAGENSPRRERLDAGYWIGAVVTNDKGIAELEIPLPEKTTEWRISAKGVSVSTLVGQASANTITRKDFFVNLKIPRSVQEGDNIQIITNVHNLTDFEGDVNLKLEVSSNGKRFYELTTKTKIEKQGSAVAIFESIEVPRARKLDFKVSAVADQHQDAIVQATPVRPWGIKYADHSGGIGNNNVAMNLELPKGLNYQSKWLTISLGASVEQQVIEMALNPIRPLPVHGHGVKILPPDVGGHAGGDLLGVVSALAYAEAVKVNKADHHQLVERARSLVSACVVTQKSDGGWGWIASPKIGSHFAVTATTYWALVRAEQAGIKVNPDTMNRALNYLRNQFKSVNANDNDAKAIILHALSLKEQADFAHVNRLYRERQGLSEIALAYTTLTFANLKREAIARELLGILNTKAKVKPTPTQPVICWEGSKRHGYIKDEIEVTSVALLAMVKVAPNAKEAKQAAEYLLHSRGVFGFRPSKSHGHALAALAGWFEQGKPANTDARIVITINGKPFKTIAAKGSQNSMVMAVPTELIGDGENVVRLSFEGVGEFTYAGTLEGFSSDLKDPESWQYPYVVSRKYYHDNLEYRGRKINVSSTSPVKNLEIGQRTRVNVDIRPARTNTYTVVEEYLPSGTKLIADSLRGSYQHHVIDGQKIMMYYPPNAAVNDFSYELVGYSTGHYKMLPTVIRDTIDPGRMRLGKAEDITVLKPGQQSNDPYQMNNAERYELGRAYFEDGDYRQAQAYLSALHQFNRQHNERETARMLLWIYTSEGFYNAQQIVNMFEILRERYPQLYIPFDKIMTVAKAYHDMGEFERAALVYRATIDSGFINDSNISSVLQNEGQLLGSIDFQESLFWQYPDTPDVVNSYFALSQLLYQQAPNARQLDKSKRTVALPMSDRFGIEPMKEVTKPLMLSKSVKMLNRFMTMFPNDPLTDDAAFSMANAYLDLKDYKSVVALGELFARRYDKSNHQSGFRYMTALGYFWQRAYEPALKAAKVVADGKSKDQSFAKYIVGQIYHAQGDPGKAIDWYQKVKKEYPDAADSIQYFEEKRISLDEVTVVEPGKEVKLPIKYRNISKANLQIYKVDLMKLYLREKNLSNITAVNLAGIAPQQVIDLNLGDGKDYTEKKTTTKLDLKEEGAYLVICRGDNLFTSGLVLITPLDIEVQEDPRSGRVRANVISKDGLRPAGVHVKAIGSNNNTFQSGDTDLRGVFVADDIKGKVTVIAKDEDSRYAFYRGELWLGGGAQQQQQDPGNAYQGQSLQLRKQVDYQDNLRNMNNSIQQENLKQWYDQRSNRQKGVQIQQAK